MVLGAGTSSGTAEYGRRHWWRLWAAGRDSISPREWAWDGFRWAREKLFIPGYRVSRGYVNKVNVTNTTVSVTRVTNVYNTVVVNKTTVNNVTYVNQRVNNGVTVVSRDTFVNARPCRRTLCEWMREKWPQHLWRT